MGRKRMSGATVVISPAGYSVAPAAAFFTDNLEDRSTGAVTLTSPWSSKGYTDVVADTLVEITSRAGAPSGLLASASVPAGKTRFLHCSLGASEANGRIVFEAIPDGGDAGVRELWYSWWEYRPNGNRGGEKFMRVGNRIAGGNRGHDIIIGWGADTGVAVFANSANMYDYGNHSFGAAITGLNNSCEFFEARVLLSTSTNSDGVVELWQNGSRIVNCTGLRMNRDAGDAARNLTLVEIGGWSSTGGGSEPSAAYPIDRWFPGGIRLSTSQLGVWSM